MNTVKEIVKGLDRDELRNRLGVGESSISMALKEGQFPSGWYKIVKALAEKKGIEVPESLFNWRQPATDDTHTAA